MYGKEIEEDKHLLHNIVVNQCSKSLETLNKKYNINVSIPIENTINERRLSFQKTFIEYKDNKELHKIVNFGGYSPGVISQHLQSLEHLENLGVLDLKKLNITNLSYEEVEINTPIKKNYNIPRPTL